MRVVIGVVIFWLFGFQVNAQSFFYTAEDAKMDSLSYKYYYYGQWKELYQLGQKLKFDKLPYYTKLRIAYANAFTGKTLISDHQYIQLANNRADTFAFKNAIYQLNASGAFARAYQLRKKALPAIKPSLLIKNPKFLNAIDFETGMGIGPGSLVNEEIAPLSNDSASYKERNVLDKNRFYRIGFSGNISPVWEWKVDLSSVQVQRTMKYQYQNLVEAATTPSAYNDGFGNLIPYDSVIYQLEERTYSPSSTTTQYQATIGLGYSPTQGLWIRPWGVFGQFSKTEITTQYVSNPFRAQSYHTIDSYRPSYFFPSQNNTSNFWMAGTMLEFQKKSFGYSISANVGNISNQNLFQTGFALNWFPFYNYKLRLSPALYTLKRGNNSPVYFGTFLADVWLGTKWNLQGNLAYGKMTNSQVGNGQYLFNFPEENLFRGGFSVARVLPSKIQVSFNLQYFQMQSTTWIFKPKEGLVSSSNKFSLLFMGIGLSKSL